MKTLVEAREYLDGLQENAGHENVLQWRDEIRQAEQTRADDRKVMDIYKATSDPWGRWRKVTDRMKPSFPL